MFKKALFIAATAALVSPLALAAHDGFYVGAQLGRDTASVDVDSSFTSGGVTETGKDSFSLDGFSGGLVLGYGQNFDQTYLGLEANGQYSSANRKFEATSSTFGTDHGEVKQRLSYGIDVVPGFHLGDDAMVYGRIGFQRTKFKTDETTAKGDDRQFTEYSDNFNGVRLGLGSSYDLNDNVTLRGEYVFTQYQEKTFNEPGGSDKVKPQNNQFNISLIYHFDV